MAVTARFWIKENIQHVKPLAIVLNSLNVSALHLSGEKLQISESMSLHDIELLAWVSKSLLTKSIFYESW